MGGCITEVNKCPCTECICRPICYEKDLDNLMKKCKLIYNYYLAVSENFEFRYNTIVEILKPSGR